MFYPLVIALAAVEMVLPGLVGPSTTAMTMHRLISVFDVRNNPLLYR